MFYILRTVSGSPPAVPASQQEEVPNTETAVARMLIRSLEAFGLSPRLLATWEAACGPELLPAQAEALQKTNLLRGGSLLLFAPTGAGKTLVGEMAALRAFTQGHRALYLVPTKALAEEKYVGLRQAYSDLGLRLGISTRDRRSDDPAILRGDFDLAVTVPEKAHYLLNLSPALAEAVGCVVVDELQMVGEPERGAALEMTLAHLLAAAPGVQIVGLSAVVEDPGRLADWLRAETLVVRKRPVELRQGVWTEGVFRYRGQNSGEVGEERWDLPEEEGWEGAAGALALHLAARGEPTLLFLRDRRSVLQMALRLSENSPLSPAPETLERLAALPPTALRRRLQETAAAGIGFHSSDLQFEDRRLLERGFASGELRVLCSTSTLAVGINLPAKNVIMQVERWQRAPGQSRSILAPVSRAEFENMGGRAGRPGQTEDFGRAILLAESGFQQEALLSRYVRTDFEPLAPVLGRLSPLSQLALLCGGREDAEEALDLYRHTFTAWVAGEASAAELPEPLQAALASATRYGLLRAGEPAGRVEITPWGRLAARSGMSLEGFYWLMQHLAGQEAPGDLALVVLAATAPEAQELGLSPEGPPGDAPWEALLAQAQREDATLLRQLQYAGERSPGEKARAARLALALLTWITAASAEEVEEQTGVPVGRLGTVAETVSWLVHVAGEIGALSGWDRARVDEVEEWSARLAAGLPPEGMPLYHALHGVANRDRVLALLAAGLRLLRDLQALPARQLRQLLPEAEWREIPALCEAWGPVGTASATAEVRSRRREAVNRGAGKDQGRTSKDEPVLCLDEGRPDRVIFHGQAVPLRPTEFRLLRALAAEPGRCLSYDQLYNALWGPDELVEPGQIHWHRSKLAGRLRRALPEGERLPLKTVPRRGFLLDLPPEQVARS